MTAARVARLTVRAGLAAGAALLTLAGAAYAGMGDPHTLIVHGRVMTAAGSPVAGAVVSSRGGYVVSMPADDRGRFTLSIPLGSASGLKRGPFAMELRAEAGGKRVPLSNGAPALGIEVSLRPGGTTVHVRSNLQDATTALATAFSQDGESTAWVDADFAAGARGSGSMDLRIADDADASGHAARTMPVIPAPQVTTPRETARVTSPAPPPAAPRESAHTAVPAPARAVAPPPAHVATPPPAHAAAHAARDSAHAAARQRAARARKPAPAYAPTTAAARDTLVPPVAAAPAPPAPRDTLAPAAPTAPSAPRAIVTRAPSRGRHRRTRSSGTPAVVVRTSSAADSAAAARGGAPTTSAPVTVSVPRSPAPAFVPASDRIKPIEPFPAPAPAAFDSCACRLFGTVEIDWERPLERNFPVELLLAGPATQQGEVEMFMGSPREFRLGPLPCGDYRLVVRPRGRYRYSVARGDSVVLVHCAGVTQVRVVLVPR